MAEERWLTFFKYCCPLVCCVHLESPFWQQEPQIIQNESKKINVCITGCSLTIDEVGREAVTLSPLFLISFGEEMGGQPGARRTSVQPQSQTFKHTLEPSVFEVRCFPRMLWRLRLGFLLAFNTAQHFSSSFCTCL